MPEITIIPVKFDEDAHRDHALLDAALAYVMAGVIAKCDGRKFVADDPERSFPNDAIDLSFVQRVAGIKLDEFRGMLLEAWRLRLCPWAAKARLNADSSSVGVWLERSDGATWPPR